MEIDMKNEIQRYSAADLRKSLDITPKVFQKKKDIISRVYDIDFTKYQTSDGSEDKYGNYSFTKYEFELLKILFNNIENSPFALTESKFNEQTYREKALYNNNSISFTSYIEGITNDIDFIDSRYLKVHIYASNEYEETVEWLSAHQKVNDSLETFFTYTNTLSDNSSSLLMRRLSYKIDELLFETLVEQDEIMKQDIKYHLNPSSFENTDTSKKNIKKNTINDFKNSYAKRQWTKKHYNNLIPDEYSDFIENFRKPIDDGTSNNLIDSYISNLLKKLYLLPLEKRIDKKMNEIKNEIKRSGKKMKNEEMVSLRKKVKNKEIIKYPMSVNNHYCRIYDGYGGNEFKIIQAVENYNKMKIDLLKYETKLSYQMNELMSLTKNDLFAQWISTFYQSLLLFSSKIDLFHTHFTEEGISKDTLEILDNDIRKLFHIIDLYIPQNNEKEIPHLNKTIIEEAKEKFYEIQHVLDENRVIKERIDNVTSWNVAEKMYINLQEIKYK